MDVPAANCVIRFDPMAHAVSFVQGRGRARAAGSAHVVCAERPGRTVAVFEAVEAVQLALVREFAEAGAAAAVSSPEAVARARAAQASRERSAHAGLAAAVAAIASRGGGAIAALNEYSKKTKTVLEQTCHKEAGGSGEWEEARARECGRGPPGPARRRRGQRGGGLKGCARACM